jgi:hypothetical protein
MLISGIYKLNNCSSDSPSPVPQLSACLIQMNQGIFLIIIYFLIMPFEGGEACFAAYYGETNGSMS